MKIWADRAYRGRFEEEAKAQGIDVKIVVPEPGKRFSGAAASLGG